MKLINCLTLSCFACLILACTKSPYNGIIHKNDIALKDLKFDFSTFKADGAATSMDGQWLMRDSLIYFIDRFSVGVIEYHLDGTFVNSYIKHGRGPNELISPAEISAIDSISQRFVIYDSNYAFQTFDWSFQKDMSSEIGWVWMIPENSGQEVLNELASNPDPQMAEMYDYNFNCNRVDCTDNIATIPVLIEHYAYNLYDINKNAKNCWKNSYILLKFDINDILHTYKLIGRYPPVYSKKNIPIFGTYDFFRKDDVYVISFAADPNIYVMDENGQVLHSFGVPGDNVCCVYPETKTFEDCETNWTKHRSQYGYYGRMYYGGGLLLRQYFDDSLRWHLQVYQDECYIGEIELEYPMEIFGYYEGYFYAYKSIDYDEEAFEIVKFSVRESSGD